MVRRLQPAVRDRAVPAHRRRCADRAQPPSGERLLHLQRPTPHRAFGARLGRGRRRARPELLPGRCAGRGLRLPLDAADPPHQRGLEPAFDPELPRRRRRLCLLGLRGARQGRGRDGPRLGRPVRCRERRSGAGTGRRRPAGPPARLADRLHRPAGPPTGRPPSSRLPRDPDGAGRTARGPVPRAQDRALSWPRRCRARASDGHPRSGSLLPRPAARHRRPGEPPHFLSARRARELRDEDHRGSEAALFR